MKNHVRKIYQFIINVFKKILKFLTKETVLIHTPKCGGTYIVKQYNLQDHIRIRNVGHTSIKSLQLSSNTKVVGLIREPLDWYQSYYFFCKKALSIAPQNDDNFPINHPISVFSKNASVEFKDMIKNMSDKDFLNHTIKEFNNARIYSKEIPNVFNFMERTKTGFWTWTMLYHFSKKEFETFKTKDEVISEAKQIAQNYDFVHQENIDDDVEKILNIPKKPGAKINVSPRKQKETNLDILQILVNKLDGEVAKILGNY